MDKRTQTLPPHPGLLGQLSDEPRAAPTAPLPLRPGMAQRQEKPSTSHDLNTGKLLLEDPRWDDRRIQGVAVVEQGELLYLRGSLTRSDVEALSFLTSVANAVAHQLGHASVQHAAWVSAQGRNDMVARDDHRIVYLRSTADLDQSYVRSLGMKRKSGGAL